MTKKDRINELLGGNTIDRPPTLGGWIAGAEHLQALSGTTEEEYWRDPEGASIKAYRTLDVDGLIGIILPPSQERYRTVSRDTMEQRNAEYSSPEEVLRFIEELPPPERLEEEFDEKEFYDEYLHERVRMQSRVQEMVWMPATFSTSCKFMWYEDFGYENYLSAVGLYPEAIESLFEFSAEEARLKNQVIARVIEEHSLAPVLLLGQDICGTGGPMVSPLFLRQRYFPHVKTALSPLHEAGIKTIWHCDGYVIPVLDDILDLGVSGLQGFQEEIGVRLTDLVQKRTTSGEKLIFFGSVSVSDTLPLGTIAEVKQAVEYSIDTVGDDGFLFLLPANTVNPDVPLENIIAMYEHARVYGAG